MNKVICDICGTSYPETEECCPICGCTRDIGAQLLAEEEDFLKDSPVSSAKKVNGRFVSAPDSHEDEDLDEEDWEDEDYEEDEEDEHRHSRGKTGAVILLVVLIMVLLAVCGYLFLRYLLPNMGEPESTPPQSAAQTEIPVETTTEPGIPCEQLILMSGAALDLTREGEYRLINVIVKPEDSTDALTYTSADEAIATVNKEGRVTAVGEGETVITIRCGNQQVDCRVFVRYVEETEPPTEETAVPTEEGNQEETQSDETDSQEETAPEETAPEETAEPTEAETETTEGELKDVVLKLGRTDISMGVGLQFTIPLDCDLSYEEIEWTTGNSNIATVRNGVITTHAQGTTQLTAKYGDQVVTCWIRVKF